jgi:uncharacterized membrane protein YqgA involved in biofilm formation
MRLPKRDIVATCAVAASVLLYVLWLVDAALPAMSSTRVTGLVILVLGFAASATAVVPGFDQLMHGNKVYLAATSLLGLTALVAGIVTLWSASAIALGVLMAALVVLWVVSTIHHVLLSQAAESTSAGAAGQPRSAGRHASVR